MPRKLPLHVHKQLTRHKKWVFYFRIGKGRRIRLPNPNNPTFKDAYRAALTGSPIEVKTVHENMLEWLWGGTRPPSPFRKRPFEQSEGLFHWLALTADARESGPVAQSPPPDVSLPATSLAG